MSTNQTSWSSISRLPLSVGEGHGTVGVLVVAADPGGRVEVVFRELRRSGLDVLQEEPDLDDGEHRVQHGEDDQRGQHLALGDTGGDRVTGLEYAVYHPGLPAHLGEDPAPGVGDQREEQGPQGDDPVAPGKARTEGL